MKRLFISKLICRIPLLGLPGIFAIWYVAIGYGFIAFRGEDVLKTSFITENAAIYNICLISFFIGAGAFLFGMFAWSITKGYPEEHPLVKKAISLRTMDYYISIMAIAGFGLWLILGIVKIFSEGISQFF